MKVKSWHAICMIFNGSILFSLVWACQGARSFERCTVVKWNAERWVLAGLITYPWTSSRAYWRTLFWWSRVGWDTRRIIFNAHLKWQTFLLETVKSESTKQDVLKCKQRSVPNVGRYDYRQLKYKYLKNICWTSTSRVKALHLRKVILSNRSSLCLACNMLSNRYVWP
jgi:hypothetical protein